MLKLRPQIYFLALFPISYGLVIISKLNPAFVESIYSRHWNKQWLMQLSQLTARFPFSLFELLVMITLISLITYVGLVMKHLFQRRSKRWRALLHALLNLLASFSTIYFIFILFWGLNYYRIPLEETLQLTVSPHSVEELTALYDLLILQTNEARTKVLETSDGIFTTKQSPQQVFTRASKGYDAISSDYPLLEGNYGSPKAIYLSKWMTYTNITGIFSPFTAEANVNTNVPESTLLFTTLHEMAHQRGIASENEANFIAFLTSLYHPDPDFQYAGYLSALNYTRHALAKINPDLVTSRNHELSAAVKRDLNDQYEFWRQYEGEVEQTFTQLNQTYLKFNGVSDGVLSYGRVVDLLLAYYDKLES